MATNVVTLGAMLRRRHRREPDLHPGDANDVLGCDPAAPAADRAGERAGVVFGYLTVVYRDVEHLMTTIFLPWFFITPIFFTLDQLPGLEGNEWVADSSTTSTS